MTRDEKRAGASLAAIFALRMLGLFLILPVFAVHAQSIPGGDNLTMVGIVLGAYGLTQSMLQIAFGAASDRYGRKRVIIIGLVIFSIGSFVAALAPDIYWVIAGRILQGAGAISAAVTALAADLTREQHRTKVMAMIGSSIGLVFALSLVIAPILYQAIGMGGLFGLTGTLALAAILLVLYVVPEPPPPEPHEMGPIPFSKVAFDKELLRLNFGIFTLHMAQMAMFVVIPLALVKAGGLALADHWKVYLPALLLSFVLMIPAIIVAEKKNKTKPVFNIAIGLILLTQMGFAAFGEGVWSLFFFLFVFFVGFNILEASLPSMISRIAPPQAKGLALGIYNTTQALGLAVGGALGGLLAQRFGADAVYLVCGLLTLVWLGFGLTMAPLPLRVKKQAA
ncbi:MAG: MFS transporter [Betaproteobacteria bacterium]|uniref:MFS transporter n=1 Tax=Candidatus Proximibacter danicus TaxID=2954365 RepID=A0A9D7PQI2_9PROT|nr:MFS transporter [Candidatus Proximibacter danicus]MBK9445333.1 MFS transporter [Betaproteobacteria bacterium]